MSDASPSTASVTPAAALPSTALPPVAHAMPHPSLFLVLAAPYGVVSGFVIVTLAYQLTQRGLGAGAVGEIIALSFLPQTWKVLWAPLVDTMSTRKRWYVGGALACAVFGLLLPGMLANAASLPMAWLGAMVVGSIASSTLAMTIESFMGAIVPDAQRGRVAGWFQAGCLGGSGLGGGLALWLIESAHWSTTAAGAALAAICGACCLALRYLPDPPSPERRHESVLAHARDIGRDLWSLARSRAGALALLICFLPISSGAASNLWAAVAGDWHAGADTVALVNGALSGVVSVAGCLVAGWLCDRMDRRVA